MPPEPFFEELKRVQKGINTLPTLIESAKNEPGKFSVLYELASKYELMGNIPEAKKTLLTIMDAGTDSAGLASFKLLLFTAQENEDASVLIEYADNNPGTDQTLIALENAMFLIRISMDDNPQLEADLFVRYITSLDKPNPGELNTFSWRMSELELYLDMALEKVIIAIEKETDDEQKFMFVDTKAEVLWKLGRTKEAIIEIEKCIQFDSENAYYQEQKDKFVGKAG